MKNPDLGTFHSIPVDTAVDQELRTLLAAPLDTVSCGVRPRMDGVVMGSIVGFGEGGATPLVTFPGQPTPAAQRARATLDLHAAHIGRPAVLVFEEGDPSRPIVIGCLHQTGPGMPSGQPGRVDVEVDGDGERLVVSARDQIILRCGKASITLTKDGKILLQGTYVSSQSSGVQRIRGGSVQIN